MHDVPRQLTVDELAELFGGRSQLVHHLATLENPLEDARKVLAELPEGEQIEALNVHPRIGDANLTGRSATEQGEDADAATLSRLAYLNQVYEEKFGFRFVVFVNRRSKAEVLSVLEERLARSRDEELEEALDELVAIARDRAT